MSAVPLVLVVGGDGLAVRVCSELVTKHGHRAVMVWMQDPEIAARLAGLGTQCWYVPGAPNDEVALRRAGAEQADVIMVLSDDDRLNLHVALKARDINPKIRIVMRQFSRTLGVKLEKNLAKCSVLSLASHSAAAFVAASLDPSCFGALQFPDPGGVLTAFTTRTSAQLGIAGLTVAEAQKRLSARVVALDESPSVPPEHVFAPVDRVTLFARIERLEARGDTVRSEPSERDDRAPSRGSVIERLLRLRRRHQIVIGVAAAALLAFVSAVMYFERVLSLDPVTATYFVATTMTSTGYGDITPFAPPATHPPKPGAPVARPVPNRAAMIVASVLMVVGVAVIGIFIAIATSALTRAQFIALQGLRRIRTSNHVLVFGCGNVGTRVVELLRGLNRHVVVVERTSDPMLEEMSSRRGIELVTGDATRDAILDLCNIARAHAVIAVTDSDTANLEVALGVRARNKHLAVVMRVQDHAFAESIKQHFEKIETFSTAELAAPVLAMISRFPQTRGRIELGDHVYYLAERSPAEEPQPAPAQHCIALGVWRNGAFRHVDTFEETEPSDRLLFLVPLSQFKSVLSQNGEAVAAGTT
ncbi:MAG TPA: NAD-binding protein [Candidatus Elarobacter sp.]